MLKRYIQNTSGNMATIFAVTVLMLLLGIGAAVDLSHMSKKKTNYQNLADIAVLAAATSGAEKLSDLNKIAQAAVDGNNYDGEKLRVKLTKLDDGTLHIEIVATYDMMIMGLFGKEKSTINVVAEAPPMGAANKLNIALVLDVTDSMEGTKITALKQAATTLIDDISGGVDGETMFSVVPFATYVQLPLSMESESWINVQPAGEDCWMTLDMDNSVNCRQVGTGEEAHTVCDVEVTKEVCEFREWDGCVASRADPWHKRDYYGGSKIEGFTIDDNCHSEMLPLTTSVSAAKNTVDNMSTWQQTYLPAGLVWGWRALMPAAPLTEANTADQNERLSALVLMTDGENSRSLGGSAPFEGVFHWFTDVDEADGTAAELCTKIKADGIVIYSVALEVTDASTIALLTNCASDAGKFYDASNTSLLQAAFEDIGNGLGSEIRLSK